MGKRWRGYFSRLEVTGGALPLKLGDFVVHARDADALLQWTTVQGLNSKDFTIERTFNATHFVPIDRVNAAGNATFRTGYKFTDRGVAHSGHKMAYYRLLMNGKDGSSVASKVVAVPLGVLPQFTFRLPGNPVAGNAQLTIGGLTESIRISVKDMSGKKCITWLKGQTD